MTAQFFIDTNILVYAGSAAAEDQAKKSVARRVIAQGGIGFSAQVMQEFYAAAVRKQRLNITHNEALMILEALSSFPVLPISPGLVIDAAKLREQAKISYWDAAIIVAAQQMGCHTLYSEDSTHEQDFSGVRVVTPFLS